MRNYWIAILFLLGGAQAAEVVDRVAVVVGSAALTESEVLGEVRITAFLNGERPDLSAASKRRAAERLVEQELIRREIVVSRYVDADQSGAESTRAEIKSRYSGPEQYQRALESYSITEDELKAHLAWQTTVMRFTEFRFRPRDVDQQLDAWLREARSRTPVEYREEAFR
jgi:hypothetical protein